MRTFIAIALPKEIKDSLAKLQEELRSSGADVKWVEPANIHLTLKFIGEITEELLEKFRDVLIKISQDMPAFKADITSVGAFPKIESPRVIWAGLSQGDKETKMIVKRLEEKLNKLGIPKEDRLFSSHITLGRTRSGLNQKALVEKIAQLKDYFTKNTAGFTVKKISLYKSTLTPQGPIYEALLDASLKTT